MPELPEVETVRAGLEKILLDLPLIKKVRLMRKDIRFVIPKELPKLLEGQKVTSVRRRAKYLLIETERVILLSHLGMTGSWRIVLDEEDADASTIADGVMVGTDKHDHCYVEFENGKRLAFRDPRRFGILDIIKPGQEAKHPRLKDLGVEPLDPKLWTAEFLFQASRKRKVPVKVFIMDQRIVVGIGNIYASESLFFAGVRPQKLAGKLTQKECGRIVESSRTVLEKAIIAGGSSIRDYRGAGGESGSAQSLHHVYDRAGQPCFICGKPIRSKVMGGRSTYWCSHCQK